MHPPAQPPSNFALLPLSSPPLLHHAPPPPACASPAATGPPLPTKDIVAMAEARDLAKKNKDFGSADHLRAELTRHGIILDDRARSWRCADGRTGILPGGRVGPTVPAALAGAVDARGRVSAAAVAAAANAAAA
eukprot:scaffold18198_cov51-Isochrysis_galbana.AAC.1